MTTAKTDRNDRSDKQKVENNKVVTRNYRRTIILFVKRISTKLKTAETIEYVRPQASEQTKRV
jgi:hypothetical protein